MLKCLSGFAEMVCPVLDWRACGQECCVFVDLCVCVCVCVSRRVCVCQVHGARQEECSGAPLQPPAGIGADAGACCGGQQRSQCCQEYSGEVWQGAVL
jgi:hypothetical protein